jgi:hypothetical protein
MIGTMQTPSSSVASKLPVEMLSRIPKMSYPELKAIAMDRTNPLATFAIAALNSREIAKTQAATAGAQSAPTIANQVLDKANAAPGINTLPNNMPQQMPPQGVTQLAQNDMPQETPQQMADGGVASLDTGDMYNEQSYANGGIVAFAKGGYSFNPEQDDPTDYYSMLQQRLAAENQRYKVETPEYGMHPLLGMKHRKTINQIMKTSPTPYDKAIEYYDNVGQIGAAQELRNKKLEWVTSKVDPNIAEEAAALKASPAPSLNTDQKNPADPNAGKGGYTYQPGESPLKGPSDTYFDTIKEFMPKGSATDGVKSERLKYNPDLFTKGMEDPEAAFTKGTERYTKYMGDNEALKNQETRLASREGRLADRESKNLGFALLAASAPLFSVRRGQEGAGITSALQTGTSEYIKGRDKIEDLKERIEDARFSVDQAKRAEKTAMFKYGDDDRRTADAAKKTAEREQKLYELKVQEKNIEYGQKDKELNMQGQLVDIKRMDLAKDIAFGNRQLSMYEDRIKTMDEATKAKFAAIKSKGIIEANKYIQANPPEVRALVKQFTDQGKKTYGNPEFDGQLNLIKGNIIGQYIDSMRDELGMPDAFANVPSATDLLNRRQVAQ